MIFSYSSDDDTDMEDEGKQAHQTKEAANSTVHASCSLMSISDDELDNGSNLTKQNIIEVSDCRRKMKRLSIENRKWKEEATQSSAKVQELLNERSIIMRCVKNYEKRSNEEIRVVKEKLCSVMELMDEKSRQVKELWNVIQMLDEANMKLNQQAVFREQSEKLLRKEIIALKLLAANSKNMKSNFHISSVTVDWKAKIGHDIQLWRYWESVGQRKKGSMFKNKLEEYWVQRVQPKIRMWRHERGKTDDSEALQQQCRYTHASLASNSVPNFAVKDNPVHSHMMGEDKETQVKTNFWKDGDMPMDFINKGPIWGSALWPEGWTGHRNTTHWNNGYFERGGSQN